MINGEIMIYIMIIACELLVFFTNANAQTINQLFRDQYANPGSANSKSTQPTKKIETNNHGNDVLKLFLNNKIHYYGVFSCGQRIDNTPNPVPSYADNVSGDLENGKSQISMSWGGGDPGKRNLDFTIFPNGSMALKGIEKTLKGSTTSYNLS